MRHELRTVIDGLFVHPSPEWRATSLQSDVEQDALARREQSLLALIK